MSTHIYIHTHVHTYTCTHTYAHGAHSHTHAYIHTQHIYTNNSLEELSHQIDSVSMRNRG